MSSIANFEEVTIFVQDPGGKTMSIDIDLNNDISHLQRKVHDRTGISPGQQVLTFCGKKVAPGHTLKDCKMEPLCTLNVFVKLTGTANKLVHNPVSDPLLRRAHFYRGLPIQDCKQIVCRLRDRGNNPLADDTRILYEHKTTVHNLLAIKTGIDELFYAFLREVRAPPLLYSGYAPFAAMRLCYNSHQVKVPLMRNDLDRIATFVTKDSRRMGRLPNRHVFPPLNGIKRFWPACDCCSPNTGKYDFQATKTVLGDGDENLNTLFITAWLSNVSFLVHRFGDAEFHYVNGTFYRMESEHISLRKTVPLHLCPVIRGDKTRSERLLVFGYFRSGVRHIDAEIIEFVPTDIIKLILAFYPNMYGGSYQVSEHNPNLMRELVQKTNTFFVDEIRCCLKYGSARDESADNNAYNLFMDPGNAAFYLVLDFGATKAAADITVVVVCCCVSCTVSKQSYTFLRQITANHSKAEYIALPDFGLESTLSTLCCDLQIVNMLRKDVVYEFPSFFDRDAYLLEWRIDGDLMARFKKFITAGVTGNVFESDVFYDLFKLRLYPYEEECVIVAIQLLTLPLNRPNKKKLSGINIAVRIYREHHKSLPINTCFDYSSEHSGHATPLMRSADLLEQDTLHLRVEIVILDSVELPNEDNQEEDQQRRNIHCGDSLNGIRYQGQQRR